MLLADYTNFKNFKKVFNWLSFLSEKVQNWDTINYLPSWIGLICKIQASLLLELREEGGGTHREVYLAARFHLKETHKTGFSERQTQATMLLSLAENLLLLYFKKAYFQCGLSVTKYLCLVVKCRMFPDKKLEVWVSSEDLRKWFKVCKDNNNNKRFNDEI